MLDAGKKRWVMIEHLEAALAFADELGDGATGYLIERALDEGRSRSIGVTGERMPLSSSHSRRSPGASSTPHARVRRAPTA
jgi:hypothetical protein